MFDNKAISLHFGRVATQYEQHAALQKDILLEGIDTIRSFWPSGLRIADIGSGTGMLAAQAEKQVLGWNITGCDRAYGMCAYAKSRNVTCVNADAHQLPFADNSFDGVFSSLMLQWANDPQQALSEMARIVRPGGYGLIISFSQGTLAELSQAFTDMGDKPHTSEFWGMNQYGAWVQNAGFAIKRLSVKNRTEHHASTLDIMRSLKVIGATHKDSTRSRGLMTRSWLNRLDECYRSKFGTKEGLPVTWKVITLLVQKK